VQWSVPKERPTALALAPVAAKEFKRHLFPLVTIFAVIAFAALAIGMLRQEKYESSATVLVEESNIIAPLMQGRVVPGDDVSRAGISREVAFGRRIMDDIVRTGGWSAETPLAQDKLIKRISSRTKIEVVDRSNPGSDSPKLNLIKITYSDSDPKRAQLITKRYAELLIQESLAAKVRDSRSAYQFIDSEVKKYERTLSDAEGKLQGYRSANPDARVGMDVDVTARIGELRREIDNARLSLIDFRSQERQLQGQLASESEVSTVSRSTQFRTRLGELQAERARLTLNYTDKHPDVARLTNQIREVEREMRQGGGSRQAWLVGSSGAGGGAALNPLYGELRSRLTAVRQQAAAAAARVSTAEALLGQTLARSRNMVMSEGTLAALTRDHAVNNELYQDLLRRRENARVSMNLSAAGSSQNFHIQEPASLPVQPSGMRLLHFAAAGLVLAVVTPLLLLALIVRHDPRVRSPLQIEQDAGLPVLGVIPVHISREKQALKQRRTRMATALFLSVPIVFGLLFILRMVLAQ
jgi:polysaccharide chain length determinant protein (PEP-CTERM system associated)